MKLTSLFLLFVSFQLTAQESGKISGQVANSSSGEPIAYAFVKLYSKVNKLIGGTKSNDKGFFSIDVPYGDYRLECTFIGYKPQNQLIKVNTPELNIGKIILQENNAKISEIVVSGAKNTKASNIDKKEYTPAQLLSSQNASAAELINSLPSVNMGNESNNLSFRGDENVSVMINGKMTSLSGQNLSQIPATSIEKIEVISVPNSKYNSEGSAGIINIVLKKAVANYQGGYVLGSVGNRDKYNAQIGYNWNINKLAIAASYNFTYNDFYNYGWSVREYLDNQLYSSYRHRSDGGKYKRLHSVRIGLDYEFDKRNSISLSSSISKDWGSSYSNDIDTFRDKSNAIYSQWGLDNIEKDINRLYDVNLSYTHWMPNMKDKWSVEVSRGDNMNDKTNSFNRNYTVLESALGDFNRYYTVDNLQRRPITAIQTDYIFNPLSNHSVETGLRMANRDFRFTNTYIENNTEVPQWTNDFKFNENVYSLYGLWSSNWSQKLTSKIGMRMEQTNTASTNYDTSLYNNNYFNAFPSAMFKYQTSKSGFVSASFSMRINRPGPGMLNPLQDVSDPISKRYGNPKLQPELINSYELAYGNDINKQISFSTSAYYRISNNAITRFLSPNTDGTISVIIDNVGRSTFSGWELIGNAKLSKSISLNLSSNLSYNTLSYTQLGNLYEANYLSWQGRGILNFKLPWAMDGQLIAFYKSPMKTPQGEIAFMSNIDISIRKKVMNQKGMFTLSVFDILNDTKFQLKNQDVSFTNEFMRKRETRYITLSFRYNFGKESTAKKPKIEKPEPREGGDMGM